MAHNQEMLEHHGAKWGDKVRIMGISIDQTVDAVKKHVKAKKWEKVEHFHRGLSSADKDYGVRGVPHVVLIDTHGMIAFIGHPAERNLEADIETLLKGEKLKGIKAGGEEAGEEEDEEGFKELDDNKIEQEIKTYVEKIDLLKQNDIKTEATKLYQGAVVLVKITQFDASTNKFLTKYENVNVLVGPEASIDKIKPTIDSFLS